MAVKRILIIAPILLIVILLQSYFWVPTYSEQSIGNPDRLKTYISASIGDASLLNPILSADSASSTIEGLVFEGLIDRDKNLHFRGRVARSWEIYEDAFFYVNPAAEIPGRGRADARQILALIEAARRQQTGLNPDLIDSLSHVKSLSILAPESFQVERTEPGPDKSAPVTKISIRVQAPARIRLTLDQVDQNLFNNLTGLLGPQYFDGFDAAPFLHPEAPVGPEKLAAWAKELLPAAEHNPVLLFHLRPGVKFHDGRPLTAADVKFTYQAIMNPQNLSPRVSDYEPVKEVAVVDPLTVKIVYKRLYAFALGTWSMGILPEHLLNRAALTREALHRGEDPAKFSMRQSDFNRHPVGSGPFKFREWKSDQYIALTRFDDYWEGPPNYARYAYRIIPDLLTQEMEFYAGTVDTYAVQPHQVARLAKDPRFQSFSGLSFGYTYIGYNLRREPFNDVRVRRALSMAIDVDKIIKYILYGQGERISGPFAKQTEYYDQQVAPVKYDPQGALELLAEAGWQRNADGWLVKDGKRLQFTLITNNGNNLRKAILAIAQDEWRAIGIDVSTDLLEWSVFIQERVDKLDFDALVLGWQMGIEPDLYQIWHSSQTGPFQLNFVGFKNKEADDLIIKIRQEYNLQKQVQYAHELHRLIAAEQPYTFLYVSKWTAVLDRRIVIREKNAAGQLVYRKIEATKTGNYTYDFNKWIKLPEVPDFAATDR